MQLPGQKDYSCVTGSAMLQLTVSATSSHGMLSFLVLVSEKAPQPPPMVCDLTLYWFQRRPLNLLPWYVILHCIGFREGPSTSPHGMLSYIALVSDKAPQPPPMVVGLPSKVPYLIIGAGTAGFAAYRSIRSMDPKAQVGIVFACCLNSAVRDYPVVLNIDRACAAISAWSDKNPSRTPYNRLARWLLL